MRIDDPECHWFATNLPVSRCQALEPAVIDNHSLSDPFLELGFALQHAHVLRFSGFLR